MRRIIAILSLCLVIGGVSSCSNQSSEIVGTGKATQKATITESPKVIVSPASSPQPTAHESVKKIVVYSGIGETEYMFRKFEELHPDFPYEFEYRISRLIDTTIEGEVIHPINAGDPNSPDIFVANESEMLRFTQGDWSKYVCSYEELGLNVKELAKKAGIDRYNMELGLGQDGKLVSLSYDSTVGVFIYRRSIANKVWGTDDPTAIEEKLGHSWEDFLEAAKELKKSGYAIVSGYDELWKAIADSADKSWMVDGALNLDPKREAYLDIAKTVHDNGYDNGAVQWTDQWNGDMQDKSDRKVFGYFGSWYYPEYILNNSSGGEKVGEGTYGDWAVCKPPINFNMESSRILVNANSLKKEAVAEIIKWMVFDTSENGLQSLLANNNVSKDLNANFAATSSKVLKQADGTSDFLGGQNPFPIYADLADKGTAKNISQYDHSIDSLWCEQVKLYVDGKISRNDAIEAFKSKVRESMLH